MLATVGCRAAPISSENLKTCLVPFEIKISSSSGFHRQHHFGILVRGVECADRASTWNRVGCSVAIQTLPSWPTWTRVRGNGISWASWASQWPSWEIANRVAARDDIENGVLAGTAKPNFMHKA